MRAGNALYRCPSDVADVIPVFPLSAALLLPGGRLPLNVFEPRYVAMTDSALAGSRLIGMIQPRLDGAARADGEPELCAVGCAGRLTSLTETGDGRYLIALQGVCRFRVVEEVDESTPFRQCRIAPFAEDLEGDAGAGEVNRGALLKAFRAYLDAHELEADWESVRRAENGPLVNALSMMAPYGAAEKQALLEAPDLKTRAETLIAITEMVVARKEDDPAARLQ
ncbi:LON peptidase substrate-binding domain-containing protein [Aquibium sp. A9E412]|uniref:LON peptidase substrate-binding domain-containing protein n=1 Tax=Aquibium sp. A9E412 TaxID=2976767 RepID=UPI0025AFB770|nr:LON peptidase substrate-binding domain-containing protein [Aquibium sp. A9E412]MDN2567402.1 LON peptidase substrate-binding domain-containing protein [Aquibium sp. A9E412]